MSQKNLNAFSARALPFSFVPGPLLLKNLLENTVNQTEHKKVVVFVDELDRCSPAYAVRFLERIKHLFDLKGVVFVLFWNRKQIQLTIENFYGAGTDGPMYLDKFIDFPFHLPASHIGKSVGPMLGLLNSLVGKFGESEKGALSENLKQFDLIAKLLHLTARETERLVRWWLISPNRELVLLETWLLGLKVKQPTIYAQIRDNKAQGHLEVSEMIRNLPSETQDDPFVAAIKYVHQSYLQNNFDNLDAAAKHLLGVGDEIRNPRYVLPSAIMRLESFS